MNQDSRIAVALYVTSGRTGFFEKECEMLLERTGLLQNGRAAIFLDPIPEVDMSAPILEFRNGQRVYGQHAVKKLKQL
jgi:hypothetical protein